MYKKTIKYVDFNGAEREEDFYFHMTKAEIVKLEFSEKGGLKATLQAISETNDSKKLLELVERIVRMSYGRRSVDGKDFIKKPEYVDAFLSSEAYSNLFIDFIKDPKFGAEFINGIIKSVEIDRSANIINFKEN